MFHARFVIETGEVIYNTITDYSKNCPIRYTQTYNRLCTSDTMKHIQYTSPECSTTQMNDPIDNQGVYIQLRGAYTHFTQSDRHYTTISLDTQWYHTAHLPIYTPETTHTPVNRNPCAYIMWISQLPVEHRPFLYHPLAP